MKPTSHLPVFLLMGLLTFSVAHAQSNGGQGHEKPRAGGKAGSRISDKGGANTNAQWSADPERGWVRAGERKDNAITKQHNGKQKTNGQKQKNK